MPDYTDSVTRKSIDSDILRLYPNAVVNIYDTGTSSPLRATAVADANGYWSIPTLIDGHYDIKVDGIIVRTIHHVRFGHTHDDEVWQLFASGAVDADFDGGNNREAMGSDVAGTIIKIKITAHFTDATGDITIHILKGAKSGGSNLLFSTDSAYNHRINPGSAEFRYLFIDNNPGITIAANEMIMMGVDFVATSVQGITALLIFRPDA